MRGIDGELLSLLDRVEQLFAQLLGDLGDVGTSVLGSVLEVVVAMECSLMLNSARSFRRLLRIHTRLLGMSSNR